MIINNNNKIIVVGIGPGSRDYILPIALRTIQQATVLVGGRRALLEYAQDEQKTFPIAADIPAVIEFVAQHLLTDNVVVMVSGDPCFHSMLTRLKKEFPQVALEVISGIGSLQMAFSKIALPWQNADIFSLHGEDANLHRLKYQQGRVLAMLTDRKNNPYAISQHLLQAGWQAKNRMFICVNLSYPDEQIVSLPLGEVTIENIYENCVVIITE